MPDSSKHNNPRVLHASESSQEKGKGRHVAASSDNSSAAQPLAYTGTAANPYSRNQVGADYSKDRKRKKRKKIITAVICVVLACLLGAIAAVWAYVSNIESNMNDSISDDVIDALEPVSSYDGGVFYMLLMGTDGSEERSESAEYAGDNFRSDSMILARVDPQNHKVTMVSLHRDTMVDIEGYGTQKLNASYSIGGAALAIKTVSQLAGVPISHYAEINFDGFEEIVDALGGVEVDVPMEIDDSRAGGHLDAGLQTLSGEQALILCRSRHAYDNYGDGDVYRAANQRLVLSAIAEKILSSDIATMANTITTLSQYVTTDFKVADIISLATSMKDIDPSNDIYSAMEPTEGVYINDTWYEQLQEDAWETMMERVREGLPPTEEDEVDEATGVTLANAGDGVGSTSDASSGVSGTSTTTTQRSGTVTIKNGNGVDGVGQEALDRISSLGYTADASNANSFDYSETVVVYNTSDQKSAAQEIVSALGCGRAVQNTNDEYSFDGDFLILIGADWK